MVLDSGGSLHGLLDGKDRWSVKLDGGAKGNAVFGSVAIGSDGTIYAGGVSGTLFALR